MICPIPGAMLSAGFAVVLADIWPICLDAGDIGRYMADKHSIAQLLSQHTERWHSPAEIRAAVTDVPDRTLRRWLAELVHEGVIERSGSRKGTRYRWRPAVKEDRRLPAMATDADAGRSTTQIQPVFSPESEQLLKRIEAPLLHGPRHLFRGVGSRLCPESKVPT
jgi:DNA-binding HxlR family transcriptional regulator